jgi:type III restriction enzyme
VTRAGNFPLSSGLARLVQPNIEELVAGRPNELIEQVTPTTAQLLRHWFEEDQSDLRILNFHEGQRAAILHIIYAHEVLKTERLQDLYRQVAPEAMLVGGVLGEVTRDRHNHPKYAAKMATGTGKTWVLNALLIWQYLNRVANPEDHRYTSNFLVVAPGLIVYDRLLDSFLGKEREGQRNFETSDIYQQQDLFIPDSFRDPVFSFLQNSVVTKADIGHKVTGGGMLAITNWHLLAGVEDPTFLPEEVEAPGEDIDAQAAVASLFPLTPGTATGNTLTVLDRGFRRGGPLEALKDLPDLLVFNDEAHHIHEVRKLGEVTEVEWQKSLTEIASTKGTSFMQVDFSATPYNEVGSGKKKGKAYFPHIVVDFDLSAAMSAGLVKALALDKRREVAALPLDFRAERDEQREVTGLSNGQRVMLRAGLKKLAILEEAFTGTDPTKHPKLLVVCEDTNVTGHVVEFLRTSGLSSGEVLAVDSNRKGEMSKADWDATRERLFDVDRHKMPRVIVSVLMLREGFDVNNICVIVPLRSSQAQILLEQTIGRGLRLMWRGDDAIDDLKRDTRDRIRRGLEPTNHFDVLFIVEHPAFSQFYDELVADGLAGEVTDDGDRVDPTGDLESVELRADYEEFDFKIPFLTRDAEEELKSPTINPLALPPSKYPFDQLKAAVGKGDQFVSEDAQTGTQYGDYRVDSGVMTATGYNDYLARMTIRISEALGSGITKSAKQYSDISRYPMLQTFRPHLTGWLNTYIRQRLFARVIDPLDHENWRVLLIDDVAHGIAGTFATAITEAAANQPASEALVTYRLLSEVRTISVRSSSAVDVNKCVYPKLPIPTRSGGLERMFLLWADSDTRVEALVKIHEHRHRFLHRPYLKADGMPAYYSPDFLVRTATQVYVVETKAQSAIIDENVQRKQRSALGWCEQINSLPPHQREDREWHYVLLGETTARSWKAKNARVTDALDFSRLRRTRPDEQTALL